MSFFVCPVSVFSYILPLYFPNLIGYNVFGKITVRDLVPLDTLWMEKHAFIEVLPLLAPYALPQTYGGYFLLPLEGFGGLGNIYITITFFIIICCNYVLVPNNKSQREKYQLHVFPYNSATDCFYFSQSCNLYIVVIDHSERPQLGSWGAAASLSGQF